MMGAAVDVVGCTAGSAAGFDLAGIVAVLPAECTGWWWQHGSDDAVGKHEQKTNWEYQKALKSFKYILSREETTTWKINIVVPYEVFWHPKRRCSPCKRINH